MVIPCMIVCDDCMKGETAASEPSPSSFITPLALFPRPSFPISVTPLASYEIYDHKRSSSSPFETISERCSNGASHHLRVRSSLHLLLLHHCLAWHLTSQALSDSMAPPPTHSPVTANPVPPYYLHSSSPNFQDTSGRSVLLRGINLSSSAKSPIGQPGAQLDGFWEHAKDGEMSFVGRVLDLENGEADVHLRRLKSWGFNCLRYVITWESIEHAGP